MKISTILDHIDSGHMALPEFQRGYVWSRDQVRGLFDSLAISGEQGSIDRLLSQLRLWHGGLRVEPGNCTGWSLGARFYPVLYWLTRMGEARDWGTGLPRKAGMLGKMSQLEVHHIFAHN